MSHLTGPVTKLQRHRLNILIFNDLNSVMEMNSQRHGPGEEEEIPVSGNIDGAKLPYVFVHDLGVEQAVSSGVKPLDE